MQTCIWPSWCHCHSLSLASVKSRLVLPFWYRLTRVAPDKGPLNVCVCACVENFSNVITSHFPFRTHTTKHANTQTDSQMPNNWIYVIGYKWLTYLNTGPPIRLRTSGNEIPPSLVITGDSLLLSMSPPYLADLWQMLYASVLWPSSWSLPILWYHRFMATFAGLTSGCCSMWPASLSLRVSPFQIEIAFQTLFTLAFHLSYNHTMTILVFPDASPVEHT